MVTDVPGAVEEQRKARKDGAGGEYTGFQLYL